MSAQISSVCNKPIIVSEKENPAATKVEERPWAKMVPEISEFLPEQRAVRFANGEIETDIDADEAADDDCETRERIAVDEVGTVWTIVEVDVVVSVTAFGQTSV